MRELPGRSYWFIAALALAAGAWLLSADRPETPAPPPEAPVLKDFLPGSYTVKSGLMARAANLAAYKNRLEKQLESGYPGRGFTLAEAGELAKLCGELEDFLRRTMRAASSPGIISQMEAAEAERRTLVLENAKLRSAMAGGRRAPRDRLEAVEESVYRLQLHLEGLAAQETLVK